MNKQQVNISPLCRTIYIRPMFCLLTLEMTVLNTATSYQSLKEELALVSSKCSIKQQAKKHSETDSTKLESPYCQKSLKGRRKKQKVDTQR